MSAVEEENSRRQLAKALISIASLVCAPKTWTAPVINGVFTPAHAQTSCSKDRSIILGRWLFTDAANETFEIEFVDEITLIFSDPVPVNFPYVRSDEGVIILNINPPRAPWEATVTKVEMRDCEASQITIDTAPFSNFTTPILGARIL